MRIAVAIVTLAGMMIAGVVFGAEESGVQPSTMEKYQKVRSQVDNLSAAKALKYAPEIIEQAKKSIASAQDGLKAGNDKVTREFSEMASLQATLATVKADEREAAAKAEAARKNLDDLNKRLAIFLSGKGDK